MKFFLHQTHHTIADFDAIFETICELVKNKEPGVHIFPELFLCGYPLQDLVLQKPFIEKYQQLLQRIQELNGSSEQIFLFGGLQYDLAAHGIVKKIENVVFQWSPGSSLQSIYTKKLLPNYDIFDEKKYFTPGEQTTVIELGELKAGILICEDMWHSNLHPIDPTEQLFAKSKELGGVDIVINLSASPYQIKKHKNRIARASEISSEFECPFLYVNRVGAEDEILFDGQSFIQSGSETLLQLKRFNKDSVSWEYQGFSQDNKTNKSDVITLTWEQLFQAELTDSNPPIIPEWDDDTCLEVIQSLIFGMQEYARKNGFKKFLVALSGGIDSGLVLALAQLGLQTDQELEAVYMPGQYSRSISFDLSLQMCNNIGIKLKSLPIKFLHANCRNQFIQQLSSPLEGLADENIQSRLRGALIYARSNQTGAMVINTSNKSELAVGYSTQYGDSVGALSLLGDLFKSQVFQLSRFINKKWDGLIPDEMITRAPSAELREDQVDEESLPPYQRLDAILECLLSYRYSSQEIIDMGFKKQEVEKVLHLYKNSEYKRFQFAPIIKIRAKSFGFGYRIPLSKNSNYLFE